MVRPHQDLAMSQDKPRNLTYAARPGMLCGLTAKQQKEVTHAAGPRASAAIAPDPVTIPVAGRVASVARLCRCG